MEQLSSVSPGQTTAPVSPVKHVPVHSFRMARFWIFSGVSSGATLALLFCIEYVLSGVVIPSLDRALLSNALIFIGFSCMLSGICYFWDFADHIFFSRKHFGVFGFLYLFAHSILFLTFPSLDGGLIPWVFSVLWLFLSLALLIYIIFVANTHTAADLGNVRWMAMLHLAYPALLFALAHTVLEASFSWYGWWLDLSRNGNPVPPVTLLGAIVAVSAFILRGVLALSVARKKVRSVSS